MTIGITDEEWDELTPENFDPRHCCAQSMPWTSCAAI